MASLPPFTGLDIGRIHWIGSEQAAAAALQVLKLERTLGFDTETKPTFVAGEVRTGPHLIQLATFDRAYCIPAEGVWTRDLLAPLLESEGILKVGFGLANDRRPLYGKYKIKLRGSLDLAPVVRKLGYRQRVGLQASVAIVLGQRLGKSKSVQLSNWSTRPLRPAQLVYAANDAFASHCVFLELQRRHPSLLAGAHP
ncbi:3'-5' exonuclease domain-containing protein 2 [Pseudoxanthomonas sp. PXM03]|nr:3'-5' exonuclease domain-containing protein 2 [Pseudoxanthomonas sp. PXM03]